MQKDKASALIEAGRYWVLHRAELPTPAECESAARDMAESDEDVDFYYEGMAQAIKSLKEKTV